MSSPAGASSSVDLERRSTDAQTVIHPRESRSDLVTPISSVVRATALFFALAALLQWWSGAYNAELSGYPDEPAHFTTGLMLRDYAVAGFPTNPVRYAENYYLHYPKVAIGHWPPLFHILEAVWLLIFPVSRVSVMLLMAVYCAVLAALLGRWIGRQYGPVAGYSIGALLIAVPIIREQTAMVMVEGLLAILAFLAAGAYSRYLEGDASRPAFGFAIFTTLAVLTKGNGWALLMLPFFAILLARRLSLLMRWSFWAPIAIVIALCAPWQMMTAHLVQQGWTGRPGPAYFFEAISCFAAGLWSELNPAILLLAVAGLIAAATRTGGAAARPASMAALFAAFYIFHGLTPVGVELRQMVPAIPALLTFVPAGAVVIGGFLRKHGFILLARPAALGTIAGLFFAGETFAATPKQSYGFREAEQYLAGRPDLKGDLVVVSSNALGEGLAITECEMSEARPGRYIIRAGKLLARSDWSGEHYEALFPSAAAVEKELNMLPAGVLVMDFTPGERIYKHHDQLIEMLAKHPPEWRLAGSFGPNGGNVRPVRVYVRVGPRPVRGDRLRFVLADELRRIEEQ